MTFFPASKPRSSPPSAVRIDWLSTIASERALKRVALGRKNWLFPGNDEAAASHARLCSLIASCQRHELDPQRYLTSVLAKLHLTPPAEVGQFLPDVWKRDDVADSLPQT